MVKSLVRGVFSLSLAVLLTAGAGSSLAASSFDTPATVAAREKMVKEQIIDRKIEDPRVIEAMKSVIRHQYVPDDRKADAYEDYPLAIGSGQTISQPYIVAYMSQLAKIQDTDKVLEVGSGSGYHGSVMAKLGKEVYSIEIVPELAERSKKVVADLGITNLTIRQGDGYFGWAEKGPFQAIVVTAAAEHVPPPLVQQLAEGGVMIIPVGHPFVTQMLVMVEKKDGKITSKELMPVKFVPLTGNRPQ
ncbi:MAG: protein-L-isoaspartate(D-aspartate) O-methyltransferase [Magnetococcales bacterium]|nr:protein-L-isoaspartate(D-aspartate) O-methyltransferase [Magnetococcales bacterium]NGZ26907.1 protein-L-isoaspartate(D-aspartate) O-methyltransferase [Magnetococcales bacterium]